MPCNLSIALDVTVILTHQHDRGYVEFACAVKDMSSIFYWWMAIQSQACERSFVLDPLMSLSAIVYVCQL